MLNKYQTKIFFTPTLFKQTHPINLILPLQNQLPQLQQIININKLTPTTSSLSLNQIITNNTSLTTTITTHNNKLTAILFTSKTKNLPKNIMLTHNNILTNKQTYYTQLNLT